MEKADSLFVTYLKLLFKELITPLNYGIAFLIGVIINYFQGIGIFESFVPFIVPIIVQSISKASVKFSNRNINVLVRLPMERKDPAFVMNFNGKIIACEGNTKEILESASIKHFNDFFDKADKNFIHEMISISCTTRSHQYFELFSEKLDKWYTVNMKADSTSPNILVWLDDISLRKKLDEKLQSVKNFSTQMMLCLDELLENNTSFDRLAKYVLEEGYEGVFITTMNGNGDLCGHVYKAIEDNIVKSDRLVIPKDSEAPIWESRKHKGLITKSNENFESLSEFYSKYRFDKRVKEFLDFEISNFVNYHEENISFIVFNKSGEISKFDLTLMEAIVNSAFTINYLVSLIDKLKN